MGLFDSPCVMLAVVGALLLAGRKATEGKDALRRWGGVAAIVVFVLTLTFAPSEDDGEIPILIVAAVRGALTLGAAWLLLAAVSFVYGQTVGAAVGGVRSTLNDRRRVAEEKDRARKELAARAETEERARRAAEERRAQATVAERERRERQRLLDEEESAALAEAERYYDEHADLLRVYFPRSMFTVWLRAQRAVPASPAERWQATHRLIAELHPLAEEAREARKHEQEQTKGRSRRSRQIAEEIEACRTRIARLQAVADDTGGADLEIAAQEEKIHKLERENRQLEEEA